MERLVFSVFKTIMIAIIMVFVFDMIMYLYRAMSLNQRMETLMTSMQKVVMENNHLPEEQANLYQQLLFKMASDFNIKDGQTYQYTGNGTNFFQSNKDAFVLALDWNLKDDAEGINNLNITGTRRFLTGSGSWTEKTVNIVSKSMGTVADYGDIQIIQVRALVAQPTWGYQRIGHDGSDFALDSASNNRLDANLGNTIEFVYTYFVPCMKYKAVTQ